MSNLIIVMGAYASGKDTTYNTLKNSLPDYSTLSISEIYDKINVSQPHTQNDKKLGLEHFLNQLNENMSSGNNIITKINPNFKKNRKPIYELVFNHNYNACFIRCTADESVLKNRILSRNKPLESGKVNNLTLLTKCMAEYEPVENDDELQSSRLSFLSYDTNLNSLNKISVNSLSKIVTQRIYI